MRLRTLLHQLLASFRRRRAWGALRRNARHGPQDDRNWQRSGEPAWRSHSTRRILSR